MARKNSNGMVQIPEVTLNALKGLLFNSNEGVDLSPIIDDLSMGEDNDLLAINVGLAFKGLTPKIDQSDRFDDNWNSSYSRYRFKGFSIITGTVKTEVTVFSLKDGKFVECSPRTECFDYSRWISYIDNEEEVQQKVLARYKKREEGE